MIKHIILVLTIFLFSPKTWATSCGDYYDIQRVDQSSVSLFNSNTLPLMESSIRKKLSLLKEGQVATLKFDPLGNGKVSYNFGEIIDVERVTTTYARKSGEKFNSAHTEVTLKYGGKEVKVTITKQDFDFYEFETGIVRHELKSLGVEKGSGVCVSTNGKKICGEFIDYELNGDLILKVNGKTQTIEWGSIDVKTLQKLASSEHVIKVGGRLKIGDKSFLTLNIGDATISIQSEKRFISYVDSSGKTQQAIVREMFPANQNIQLENLQQIDEIFVAVERLPSVGPPNGNSFYLSAAELATARPSFAAKHRYDKSLPEFGKEVRELFKDSNGILHSYSPVSYRTMGGDYAPLYKPRAEMIQDDIAYLEAKASIPKEDAVITDPIIEAIPEHYGHEFGFIVDEKGAFILLDSPKWLKLGSEYKNTLSGGAFIFSRDGSYTVNYYPFEGSYHVDVKKEWFIERSNKLLQKIFGKAPSTSR